MTRLVLLAALLAACSSKADSGPPCDKVVDHMMELTKQMMPGHDPQSLGDRKQMIDQCVNSKWSAAMRKCRLDAKSFNDLAACGRKGAKPPAPMNPAPEPTRPLPTAPEPGSAAPGSAG
ncbi:MAG TPA: hypothetical protein VIV11_39015 [Kofleriaceae bacterium]